jgi:hypothetical protein
MQPARPIVESAAPSVPVLVFLVIMLVVIAGGLVGTAFTCVRVVRNPRYADYKRWLIGMAFALILLNGVYVLFLTLKAVFLTVV